MEGQTGERWDNQKRGVLRVFDEALDVFSRDEQGLFVESLEYYDWSVTGH